MAPMMKAAVFLERNRIEVVQKPIPEVGPNDALMRITTTPICGTDVHIPKGEYPVAKGLTVGHEPVGVIEKLGSAVPGLRSFRFCVILASHQPQEIVLWPSRSDCLVMWKTA